MPTRLLQRDSIRELRTFFTQRICLAAARYFKVSRKSCVSRAFDMHFIVHCCRIFPIFSELFQFVVMAVSFSVIISSIAAQCSRCTSGIYLSIVLIVIIRPVDTIARILSFGDLARSLRSHIIYTSSIQKCCEILPAE